MSAYLDLKKSSAWLLAGIFLLALWLRLFQVTAPLADEHAWKQTEEASIAYHLYRFGPSQMGVFFIQPEQESPQKVFYEVPLYAGSAAAMYHLFGPREISGRLISIFFSLLSMVWFFLLLRRYLAERAALAGLFFFAFSPLHWFFSRSFQSDMPMLACTLGTLYFYDGWLRMRRKRDLVLAFVLSTAGVTFKSFGIFIFLPLGLLAFSKWRWRMMFKSHLVIMGCVAVLPTIAWYLWTGMQTDLVQPTGNAGYWGTWAFLADPEFYYQIFFNRMTERVILYVGFGLFLFAFLSRAVFRFPIFLFWLLQPLAQYLVFRQASYVHEYYQLTLLAPTAAVAAVGFESLRNFFEKRSVLKKIWPILVLILFSLSFYLSVRKTARFYRSNPAPILAAERMAQFSDPDEKILSFSAFRPIDGPEILFYYARRRGWAFDTGQDLSENDFAGMLETYRAKGARYLVLLTDPQSEERWWHSKLSPVLKDRELLWQEHLPQRPGKKFKGNILLYFFGRGRFAPAEEVLLRIYSLF